MIKKDYKRLTLTLKKSTVHMLNVIASEAKITKSKIMQQLMEQYTNDFWCMPKEAIESWVKYANTKK